MISEIKYSWNELNDDSRKIARWVKDVNFKPDYIVGILRGGAIPAVIISHIIHVPVIMVDWSIRDGKQKDYAKIDQIAVQAATGKKFLFVDDIVDSGKTIGEIKERIFDTNNNVLYTSLWYNPSQISTIHFWSRVIDRNINNSWIVFPYET